MVLGLATQRKHLDDRSLRVVGVVLRTSLTLCHPDGALVLNNLLIDICRQLHRSLEQLATGNVTTHDEALIHPDKVLDPWGSKKVVADGDFGSLLAVLGKNVVEQSRIKHNVAMVGHKEMSVGEVNLIKSVSLNTIGAFFAQHIENEKDYLGLKILYCLATQDECLHLLGIDIRESGLDGAQYFRTIGQWPKFRRDVCVVVATNVIKIVFCHNVFGFRLKNYNDPKVITSSMTSEMSRPAALTSCGINEVAVMPGVVLTSRRCGVSPMMM